MVETKNTTPTMVTHSPSPWHLTQVPHNGHWYIHGRDGITFAQVFLQLCDAVVLGKAAIVRARGEQP